MMNWDKKKLSEVCEILDKHREPINNTERNKRIEGKTNKELYPYYGATGQVGYIDDYLLDGEYVLLGEDGAPFLEAFRSPAYLVSGKIWVNNHAHVLKAKKSNKFLLYYLSQIDYRDYVSGTTRLKLTQTSMKNIHIPDPSHTIQNRIVEKIEELFSELDNGVENLKRAQEQLKVYRKAVLKDAFEGKLTAAWREQQTDLPSPEELLEQIKAERKAHRERELAKWEKEVEQWEKDGKVGIKPNKPKTHKIETPLEEIKSNISNNFCSVTLEHVKSFSIYGPRYSSKDYEDNGITVLRTSDISEGGKVDWKNAPKIPLSDYDFNKYKLEKGDLLITRTGSIGTISVFNDEVEAIPGAFLIHYRLIPEVVNTWYIYYFLKTNKAQNHFIEKSAGIGRPNLNVPSIEELLIPLPGILEQKLVVEEIESRLSVVDQLEQTIQENLQKAEALRQSILKKAFSGEFNYNS